MKLRIILIVVLGSIVAGCAEKEQSASKLAAPEAAAPIAMDESWRSSGFLEHMHLHAEKLDDINLALADDDLEGARTPAYWLSRHETYEGIQQQWLPYLYGMRNEAEAVEIAADLESARVAARRLEAQCESCHAAAGVDVESLRQPE